MPGAEKNKNQENRSDFRETFNDAMKKMAMRFVVAYSEIGILEPAAVQRADGMSGRQIIKNILVNVPNLAPEQNLTFCEEFIGDAPDFNGATKAILAGAYRALAGGARDAKADEKFQRLEKHIDDLIEIYKNDKEFKNDKKLYEHKSIGIFPFKSCKNNHYKNYFKILRNNFHRIKIKYANLKNKEQEFTLSDKLKKKFRLDLIINNKKTNNNNEYTIIPINNNDNSDKDSDDMGNFRGTISYNQSKLKKEKDSQKIVNIYEVLRKSVK